MCTNGRAPAESSRNWLACILYGYLRGYAYANGRRWGRFRVEDGPVDGTITIHVGYKSYRVVVTEA